MRFCVVCYGCMVLALSTSNLLRRTSRLRLLETRYVWASHYLLCPFSIVLDSAGNLPARRGNFSFAPELSLAWQESVLSLPFLHSRL